MILLRFTDGQKTLLTLIALLKVNILINGK